MAEKLEVLSGAGSMDSRLLSAGVDAHYWRDLREIAAVFVSILIALWTPQGKVHAFFSIVVAACVVAFAIVGRWSARELGLSKPLSGLWHILAAGAVLCGVIALIGIPLQIAGAGNTLPLSRSWQYGLWALQQQFILQSIFFLRLEAMLGPRRAAVAAASLFAIVHIPSPILMVLSFCGGTLFCELFRRWRNLYPLGVIHGALGLTIAASLPDKWLHHMRVGVGYLMMHS